MSASELCNHALEAEVLELKEGEKELLDRSEQLQLQLSMSEARIRDLQHELAGLELKSNQMPAADWMELLASPVQGPGELQDRILQIEAAKREAKQIEQATTPKEGYQIKAAAALKMMYQDACIQGVSYRCVWCSSIYRCV